MYGYKTPNATIRVQRNRTFTRFVRISIISRSLLKTLFFQKITIFYSVRLTKTSGENRNLKFFFYHLAASNRLDFDECTDDELWVSPSTRVADAGLVLSTVKVREIRTTAMDTGSTGRVFQTVMTHDVCLLGKIILFLAGSLKIKIL